MAKFPDEQLDLALVSDWLGERGLTATRFSQDETQASKTPDFRVLWGGQLVAYCEVKSPNDPWLDKQLELAQPLTLVGGVRDDPTFNRIARSINNADKQFAAVNSNRAVFNILAFVNHDRHSHFADLKEVLTGHLRDSNGGRHPTSVMHISERIIGASKWRIDAYTWFDRVSGKPTGIVLNDADHARRDRVCALLKVDHHHGDL